MLYYNGLSRYINFLGIKKRIKAKPKHYEKVGIIFNSNAGLGNRIFGLINVINYFTPDEIDIFWDNIGWVSAKFYDLFDVKFKTKIKEYNDREEFDKATKEFDLIIENPDVCIKTLNGKSLGLKYDKIDKNTFLKYQKNFQYLHLKKELIEKIKQNTPENNFVAVQIRNAPDWEDFGRNENLNLFVSEMNKFETKNFYISAMNGQTTSELRKVFDKKIFELQNKNYHSMQDAVCDLYIMAKADKAIYSFGSTFGELSFWLNENMQKVTIVGSQKHWINKKHLQRRQKILSFLKKWY